MKNNIYPCKAHFLLNKMEFSKVFFTWACFCDKEDTLGLVLVSSNAFEAILNTGVEIHPDLFNNKNNNNRPYL